MFGYGLFILLFIFPISEQISSIKVRGDVSVFSFFSRAGRYVVDREIPKIQIPTVTIPITGGPGQGSVTALNMNITKFKSPSFEFSIEDDRVSWQSHGGTVKIGGNWQAEYTFIAPWYESGWVQALASDIKIDLSASVEAVEGKPQILVNSCSVDISEFAIEIGGGVLPWLVNLFRSPLSEAIRQQIHKQACSTARSVFLEELNDFLLNLPSHIPIGQDFYVDYSLDSNPTFFESEAIEIFLSADIVYGNITCKPMKTGNWTDLGAHKGMVTVWMSENVPNCLLSSTHRGGLLHFPITKDIDQAANYLRTRFNATIAVDFHLNPMKENPTVLTRIVIESESIVLPMVSGNRLIGVLNGTVLNIHEEFSTIGDVSQTFLNVFQRVFSTTIQVFASALMHKGVPFPIYDNDTIANTTTVDVLDHVVRVNLDFINEE